MTVGKTFFSQKETKVLGKEGLQIHINEQTDIIIDILDGAGLGVSQSSLISSSGFYVEDIHDFVILARSFGIKTIYLHWKVDFLEMPVFWFYFDNAGKLSVVIWEVW